MTREYNNELKATRIRKKIKKSYQHKSKKKDKIWWNRLLPRSLHWIIKYVFVWFQIQVQKVQQSNTTQESVITQEHYQTASIPFCIYFQKFNFQKGRELLFFLFKTPTMIYHKLITVFFQTATTRPVSFIPYFANWDIDFKSWGTFSRIFLKFRMRQRRNCRKPTICNWLRAAQRIFHHLRTSVTAGSLLHPTMRC